MSNSESSLDCIASENVAGARAAEEEKRSREMGMERSQKLESLGLLADGVVHDFNNFLMGILGHASLALEMVEAGTEVHESLQCIEDSANSAAKLCKKLQAYSGKAQSKTCEMEFSTIVSEMISLARIAVPNGIPVEVDCPKDLQKVRGNPDQIGQVVMNLLMNAADAHGENAGVIRVRTFAQECDATLLADAHCSESVRPGCFVCMEVSDSGSGIDSESQSRLFEPYYTTRQEGRGLGLTAVEKIVAAHEGVIHVESSIGEGTRIQVFFPAVVNALDVELNSLQSAVSSLISGTVLVVDDEESVRHLASRMLQRVGLKVITAGDGEEAVDVYRDHAQEISLVLLDLSMPSLTGEEACREICGIREDALVVVMSGYQEDDVSARFKGTHVSGYLQKPYTANELYSVVEAALG